MSDYQKIIPYYDKIFPVSPDRVNHILSLLGPGSCILDMGTGTGTLASRIAERGIRIYGVDPDPNFIENALNFNADHPMVTFLRGGIEDIEQIMKEHKTDRILCIGNTLVHVPKNVQKQFIGKIFANIPTKGRALIQIINYSRIFNHNLKSLSTIENEDIKFERIYSYNNQEELIFHTILTDKKTGSCYKSDITLYPTEREELLDMVKGSGFVDYEIYGSPAKTPYSDNGIQLVLLLIKS